MPLHSSAFDEYLPFVNDAGEITEERSAHFRRVRQLLPNFPEQVLHQWVYEHWSDVGRYDWLSFPTLEFKAETWTTEQVQASGVGAHPLVEFYSKHLEAGDSDERTERIAQYMQEHGTWPVAPLFVANPAGRIHFPDGGCFCSPFHPIEGQHRVGAFMSFARIRKLRSHHAVWRVTVQSAA